jgi:hypothetical protein
MTSSRLLNTTRNGFARELLSSAASDHAPAATRERVLASVSQALASAGENDSLGSQVTPAAVHYAAGGGSGLIALIRPRRSGAFLGLLAFAAGIVLLLWQGGKEHGPATARGVAATAGEQATSAPDVVAASAPVQGSLANTRPLAPLFQTGAPPLATTSAEETSDWLGAQLQLLGEARRQLELGELEQTHDLLEGYGRRFPDGVLGPQIAALRAELQQRQHARAPRRKGAQLNLSHR